MLVLSRQRDESVMIGDAIEVSVVDIRGDKVRLGFTAPRALGVHRTEVYKALRREVPALAAGDTLTIDFTSGPVPSEVRVRMSRLRDRLACHRATFISQSDESVVALEDGAFGVEYVVTRYVPLKHEDRWIVTSHQLGGFKTRGEAMAFYLGVLAEQHLHPSEAAGIHLKNTLKLIGRGFDEQDTPADVPPAPAELSSK